MQGQGTVPESRAANWIARLAQQATDIENLVSGLSEEELSRQTTPGKWSIKEILCHLQRFQQVVEGRLTAMLTEENPAIESYDTDQDEQFQEMVRQPFQVILTQYSTVRTLLTAELQVLSPEEWDRRGRHPEYPEFDVAFQVEYLLYHEGHHIYQLLQRREGLRAK